MTPRSNPPPGGTEQSFISHLIELRSRLLRSVLTVIVLLAALMPFSQRIYTLLADPLMRHLPKGATMIATEVASPFLTPFKLTLIVAVVLAMPIILYQIWAFVAPGLYQSERRIVLPLVVSSAALFYLGMAFAYYVVFPMVFAFFTSAAPEGVTVMTDINKYLDFVLTLFFAFGVAFEVPVATVLLVWAGITSPEALVAKRPYIIVAAFVIGMLLTPPDVISQTLLAVPMWMLFELGVALSRWLLRTRLQKATQPASSDAVPDTELDRELQSIEAIEQQVAERPPSDRPTGDPNGGHRPNDGSP
jgi:sec-independent protein translocase protein TatC